MVTFNEILSQTIAMLHQHGRVSYRALKRQFAIPDDYLEDLKDAILFAHPQVIDEQGRGLVWTGDAGTASVATSAPVASPEQTPLAYTPPYLAEKIRTVERAIDAHRDAEFTWTTCEIVVRVSVAAYAHDLDTFNRFERANENRMRRIRNVAHNVELVIHPIDKVDVSHAAGSVHRLRSFRAAPAVSV